MNSLNDLLNLASFPTSQELKVRTLHDSAFSTKTRFVKTAEEKFTSSLTPLPEGTWSFNSLENDFPTIKSLCEGMTLRTGLRVQCNAYLTPPGAQGLPIHYDLHDVLIVQTEGSKKWKIWKSFRKEVSIETLLADEKNNLLVWTSETAAIDLNIKVSETLYLTKGTPHVATTTNETSLHFSFGLYND